jgi:hypothetical protein
MVIQDIYKQLNLNIALLVYLQVEHKNKEADGKEKS